MSNKDDKVGLAVKALYDYQSSLITRRWNVFIGYLIANGLMLNVFQSAREAEAAGSVLSAAIAASGVVLSGLFLQLINVLFQRIIGTYRLLAEYGAIPVVIGVRRNESPVLSVTGILYLLVLVLGLPWFFALASELSVLMAGGAVAAAIPVTILGSLYLLGFLKLKWPKRGYVEELREQGATMVASEEDELA